MLRFFSMLRKQNPLMTPISLFFAALLWVHCPLAANAAISMETGNDTMRLDGSGELIFGTGAPAAPTTSKAPPLQGAEKVEDPFQNPFGADAPGQDKTFNTPQRPVQDTSTQELPYGIVPEVHVPWIPPQFNQTGRPPIPQGPSYQGAPQGSSFQQGPAPQGVVRPQSSGTLPPVGSVLPPKLLQQQPLQSQNSPGYEQSAAQSAQTSLPTPASGQFAPSSASGQAQQVATDPKQDQPLSAQQAPRPLPAGYKPLENPLPPPVVRETKEVPFGAAVPLDSEQTPPEYGYAKPIPSSGALP